MVAELVHARRCVLVAARECERAAAYLQVAEQRAGAAARDAVRAVRAAVLVASGTLAACDRALTTISSGGERDEHDGRAEAPAGPPGPAGA